MSLRLADVPDITHHALNMTIFRCSYPSGTWIFTHVFFFFFIRYVDSRLLFAPQSFLKLPCMQLLQRMDFYGQAIILEDEQEYDFLGFHIDYSNGCIKYNKSLQDVDLLHPLSAAPRSVLLSRLLSRAFLMKKCGYQTSQVERDLHFLWKLANKRGLPVHDARFKSCFFRLKNKTRCLSDELDVLPTPLNLLELRL